jgi:AAA domain/Sulfatase-modifying factor enzyme 1
MLEANEGSLSLVNRLADLKVREFLISARFLAVPKLDYIDAKSKIESLNTQHLAERIDERLIEFHDNKRNDAMALGKIIREKQRFPIDKFADIQRAFPCIIAGLRDYAEFIPLERELFDLVIIDEASQVSIAQALPAIIRAKKILVLGDRNQFGNVKTSNASKEVNIAFMQDLIKAFTEDFADVSQAVRTKIDLFNIKSSVLDFIEPISNFSIQLKKHFRSYPEMISFSSKHFYGDSLQVMKIRGKLIEDVIEFDPVDHDGLVDKRNVNVLEAKRIVDRVVELLDLDPMPSVGIITPHTEQQAFIAKLFNDHPRADEMYDSLRLKVMTFDTCQGEEREIIFYSLVATAEKDRLAYVFPSKLDRDGSEEVDHNLRLQRLNVGLSRGQEKLVFVHSKPTEGYSSALKVALQHYRNELERSKLMPSTDDLDDASPMERKVLHWLSQVPLIRDLGDDCEVIAQFELGKYLKQLDPSYRHPDYRVDFLVRVSNGRRQHQLVLEYDGFEFHFEKGVPVGMINATTWRAYLTSEDLEREKVLEGFGVQMIRLNRFNRGEEGRYRRSGNHLPGHDLQRLDAGADDGGARGRLRRGDADRGVVVAADRPAVQVSWHDANGYAGCLSRKTGETYRLPTDEEWAFAAGSKFKDDGISIDENDPSNAGSPAMSARPTVRHRTPARLPLAASAPMRTTCRMSAATFGNGQRRASSATSSTMPKIQSRRARTAVCAWSRDSIAPTLPTSSGTPRPAAARSAFLRTTSASAWPSSATNGRACSTSSAPPPRR